MVILRALLLLLGGTTVVMWFTLWMLYTLLLSSSVFLGFLFACPISLLHMGLLGITYNIWKSGHMEPGQRVIMLVFWFTALAAWIGVNGVAIASGNGLLLVTGAAMLLLLPVPMIFGMTLHRMRVI